MSAKKILLAQYDLHILLFNNVIEGISDEEANQNLGRRYPKRPACGQMLSNRPEKLILLI